MASKKSSTLNHLTVKNINVGHKYDKGQQSFEADDVNIRNTALIDGKMSIGTEPSNVSLDIKSVSAIKVPVGTTAERPVYPKVGYIRYNSELMIYEGYKKNLNTDANNNQYFTYEWIQISGGMSL